MELWQSVDFWIGLLKIVWINIILSGDNAVVIAAGAALVVLLGRKLQNHPAKAV